MKKNVVWNAGVTIRYKGGKTTPETETRQAQQWAFSKGTTCA